MIDDDLEDHLILDEIFKNLNYPNRIIYFSNGEDAVEYLRSTHETPLLILSDINMPGMNGFEIRNKIAENERMNLKCIPYLFFTTSVDRKAVEEAYALSVHGYFVKPTTMTDMQNTLRKIIDYWQESFAPSQFN